MFSHLLPHPAEQKKNAHPSITKVIRGGRLCPNFSKLYSPRYYRNLLCTAEYMPINKNMLIKQTDKSMTPIALQVKRPEKVQFVLRFCTNIIHKGNRTSPPWSYTAAPSSDKSRLGIITPSILISELKTH